jgi:beta-glucuronidase
MKLFSLPFSIAFVSLVALLFAAATCAPAQSLPGEPIAMTGADRRPQMSLNGEWHAIPDPYGTGLYDFHNHERKDGWFLNQHMKPGGPPMDYDFATAPTLKVPGDWNTQRPQLFWYEGPMWYEKDFQYAVKPGTKVFLRIGAANYKSIFWVNGTRVCEHEGGFTAFNCDATAALKDGANFVVAMVDDTRRDDGVPTTQTDWFNYGGLTREVSLIAVPEAFIDQYDLHLSREDRSKGHNVIEGWVHVEGGKAGDAVSVSIGEAGAKVEGKLGADGRAAIRMEAPELKLWTPETPKLYAVSIKSGADSIEDSIGFRTIEVKGTEILLNGKPIFLRGVSIHAEAPYRTGRAWSEKDAETLLGWAKELGCNYARLAHYPHDENMLRAADRMGVLIWSENPVYWAVEFDNPAVYDKARRQLEEEIGTSRNHAAIILWSMANETPVNDARTKFISSLAARARELDPTRLITAALLVRTEGTTKIVDDPLGAALDVIGTNEYVGWYEGDLSTIDKTAWQVAFDKPQIMSEFGAGAKAGKHAPANGIFTEEYQAALYRHQIGMLNKIPQLRGMSPWCLMDFRSPRRTLTGIQDEFNRKGLVSDQGVKKQAFAVLQKAYLNRAVGKAE